MSVHPSPPSRRVVVLGASNVALSLPAIVETARRSWNEPVEFMVAMGHGRSYGQDSSMLGRKISGIFPCALWRDLEQRPPLPTVALVTDIGNDLLYGVPVPRLLKWVSGCLARLAEQGATTVVTELPAANLEAISEARFRFFRRLLFPRSSLTLAAAKTFVREVNHGVRAFGEREKISVIPASSAWYGLDPIHLSRRARREIWPQILSGWRAGASLPIAPRATPRSSARLRFLAPSERWILGVRCCREQPSRVLEDGATISLY